MSRRSKSPLGILGVIFGFIFGSGLMMFLGKKKGKDLRKEILESWEKGKNPVKSKLDIYMREMKNAATEIKPAVDEFIDSPKMKQKIEEGKQAVDKAKKEVKASIDKKKKAVKKTVKKAKKEVGAKVKEVKKDVASKIRDAAKLERDSVKKKK